ncbi:Pleckstrin homology domain-containing family M member 2 [Geodia barretti]|uniref:Pleckstrin homology domain-containing family M member 2 n=1 Tax=Geodia barretti TaxID=519541 RepID=A0AA35W9N7_GEOBA|nr:Pleckstrin homology domain-containing family M member 2 [Geodia barretti]
MCVCACVEMASGLLYFKKNSRVGLSSWKQGFFRLIDGTLHQFGSETDKLSKATFSLAGCGGVTRVVSTGDSRQFVLSLSLAGSQPLLLATGTEEELTQWQMALCEAVLQVRRFSQQFSKKDTATYVHVCMCMIIYTQ